MPNTPSPNAAGATPQWHIEYDYQDKTNMNHRGFVVLAAATKEEVIKVFAAHDNVERINNISVKPL